MSRDDFARAGQLVRLRDLALDTAMRNLGTATAALAEADAALAKAAAGLDQATAKLAEVHRALVDNPADSASGLARIALADEQRTAAATVHEAAVTLQQAAETAVIAARVAVRRAQSRRDAMADRALRLRRALARAAEEHAALEAEEGAAAMRNAA